MVDEITNIPIPGIPNHHEGANSRAGAQFVLDRFFAGPENLLVEVAVRSVLNDQPGRFNPLFFHGSNGTGKSHLACGIAAQQRHRFRGGAVCVSAKQFARELADAFEVNAVPEFRTKYRDCSLFVLEDVEALSGRSAAQIELVHTFDALLDRGAQMILTASASPARLNQLLPTLASRLSQGLVVALAPPGVEARMVLLRHLAQLRHIELTESVGQILAEGLCGTVPDLFAAVGELASIAPLDRGTIGAESAREFARRQSAVREPPLADIAVQTARYFGLRLADLRGPSRRRAVVTARDVAMYLARLLTNRSFDQIGEYFGGRDHTTVAHGCRKTGNLLKSDPAIDHAVQKLTEKWRTAQATQSPPNRSQGVRPRFRGRRRLAL